MGCAGCIRDRSFVCFSSRVMKCVAANDLSNSTCATSAVRLYTVTVLVQGGDNTYDNAPSAMWSAIEVNTAIMCACMQSLKPLVQKLRPQWFMHSQSSSNGTASSDSGWKLSQLRRVVKSDAEAGGSQNTSYTEPILGPMLGDPSCWSESISVPKTAP